MNSSRKYSIGGLIWWAVATIMNLSTIYFYEWALQLVYEIPDMYRPDVPGGAFTVMYLAIVIGAEIWFTVALLSWAEGGRAEGWKEIAEKQMRESIRREQTIGSYESRIASYKERERDLHKKKDQVDRDISYIRSDLAALTSKLEDNTTGGDETNETEN